MIKVFSIIFIFLLLVSCDDNPTVDNSNNSFSVEIEVVDSTGHPLPDINVSLWNKIKYATNLNKTNSFNGINASTTIQYQIVQQCFVKLVIYDLDNDMINELVSGKYNAGIYAVAWSTSLKNGAYKCKLITSSDSLGNNVLFRDSIYIALISPDPSASVVGSTDNNGKIKVVDKLLFPNLFNLPSIPRTLEGGPEIVGYFNYSDSVVIALSNISFTKTVLFNRLVINGKNSFIFKLGNDFLKFEKDMREKENQYYNSKAGKDNFFGVDSVVLTSFTATISNDDVILHWITSQELNNQGFEIQRKNSGNPNWNTIGFVNGNGTTNEVKEYYYWDNNLNPGSYMYRLKQIDFDGSFSYSEEIDVEFGLPLEWELYQNYPNPFN